MKKFFALMALTCLALLMTGCLFGGGKTYDGSEQYYQAHPEQNNPPEYMQPGDRHSDGN